MWERSELWKLREKGRRKWPVLRFEELFSAMLKTLEDVLRAVNAWTGFNGNTGQIFQGSFLMNDREGQYI